MIGVRLRGCGFALRSLRGLLLVAAFGELLDQLLVERWNVVGLATGHEAVFDDDLLLDSVAARIPDVCLKRRPGGQRPIPHDARLD